MARRRKSTPGLIPGVNFQPHVPPVLNWTITEEWTHNGRHVAPGTELKIKGETGRFRFIRHVRNEDTGKEWVDVIHDGGFRAFRPERVVTVHRTLRTRANATPHVRKGAAA